MKLINSVELDYAEHTRVLVVRVDKSSSIWAIPSGHNEEVKRFSDRFKPLDTPKQLRELYIANNIYSIAFAQKDIYLGVGSKWSKELPTKGRILRKNKYQRDYTVIDDELSVPPEKIGVVSDHLYALFFKGAVEGKNLVRYNLQNRNNYPFKLKHVEDIAATNDTPYSLQERILRWLRQQPIDTLYALHISHLLGVPSERIITPIDLPNDVEAPRRSFSISEKPGYNKIGIDSNLLIWLNESPPLGYGKKFIIANQYGAIKEATIDLRVDAFTFNQKNELIAAGRNENNNLMLQKYNVEGL